MNRHWNGWRCITLTALFLVGMLLLGGAAPARASDKESDEPESGASAKGLDELKQAAKRYRITLDEPTPRELVLKDEPVLRWTNPLRKTNDGAVFVWLSGGRPEVIASFYRVRANGETREEHEFQSLATTPLSANRDGRTVWAPRGPGVVFQPVPGAPAPAAKPAERLRQMRALSREFEAAFDNPPDRSKLRLLSQPLYRYESERAEADGALFAFVLTTDPEVLLLIESRPSDGAPAWHYAIARMSMVNLRAGHKGRDVWRAEWVTNLDDPSQPYVTVPGSPLPQP